MHGRKLRKLFQELNQRYFGGKLPPYRIRCVEKIAGFDGAGHCDPARRVIRIKKNLPPEEVPCTLVHEMVHAELRNGYHGKRFYTRLQQLKEKGAPVSEGDLQGAGAYRVVTKHLFKTTLTNMMCDLGVGVPFRRAVELFIWDCGGANSVVDFLRRYPWARKVYQEAKREFAARPRVPEKREQVA